MREPPSIKAPGRMGHSPLGTTAGASHAGNFGPRGPFRTPPGRFTAPGVPRPIATGMPSGHCPGPQKVATSGCAQLNAVVALLEEASLAGAQFLFAYLSRRPAPCGDRPGAWHGARLSRGPPDLALHRTRGPWPYRILPLLVSGFSRLPRRTLVGGAVGLGAAVSIFVGMVEVS